MAHIADVDPLDLMLSGQAYIRLTLPDPPAPEVLREIVENMRPDEKRLALARIRALSAYVNALEKELKKG
jgi:hypothetical protein